MTAKRSDPLLALALEGERVVRAAQILEREGPRLLMGLRRAVPFLSRRRVPMKLGWCKARPLAEIAGNLDRPFFTVPMTAASAGGHGARGALLLDAGAISLFLDGVLGGDGTQLPTLDPKGLSSPQTALVSGVALNLVSAFSDMLQPLLGARLQTASGAGEGSDSHEGALIACALEIGDEAKPGLVVICIPKELLLAAVPDSEPPEVHGDPRIESVLAGVELEMVAELGRVRMRVRDVAKLAVGDLLRLDVSVSSEVTLRADTHEIFRGRPTTSAGQIALALGKRAERHER